GLRIEHRADDDVMIGPRSHAEKGPRLLRREREMSRGPSVFAAVFVAPDLDVDTVRRHDVETSIRDEEATVHDRKRGLDGRFDAPSLRIEELDVAKAMLRGDRVCAASGSPAEKRE